MSPSLPRSPFAPALAVCLLAVACLTAPAADKTTYQDDVLPIFRNKCLQCHNADKKKADLNLSTFQGALKGSNSGTVLEGGNPEGSFLYLAITHAEEPSMPPNDKLPDGDIATIRQWILGGLLETAGSKAILSDKPKLNLAISPGQTGKPDGPPPMPEEVFALDPYVRTERTSISTALDASPWSPLVAIGGQHQILLYNTDTLRLEGVIPFPEGYPHDVKFSANGKLLVVGGGRGASLGLSTLWDITSGEKLISVGEDYDAVLATDIAPDQRFIAHGGPDRLVRIFATSNGRLVHKIKKHTDWVTAVRFSPTGKMLATGDRGGGLHVWDVTPGSPVCTLDGHKDRITGIVWAATNIVMSASEDGNTKIWNTDEMREIKNWKAHANGVLGLSRSPEGLLVTCGRDRKATSWDANGSRQRDFNFPGDLPSRAVPSYDGKRIIGSDWNGLIYVWDAKEGTELGRLSLNPLSIADQLAAATVQAEKVQAALGAAQTKLQSAEAALAETRAQLSTLQSQAQTQENDLQTAQAKLQRLTQEQQPKLAQEHQAAPDDQKPQVQQKLAALEQEIQAAKTELSQAEAEAKNAAEAFNAKQEPLTRQIEERTKQVAEARQGVETAQVQSQTAATESERLRVCLAYSDYFKAKEAWRTNNATLKQLLAQVEAARTDLEQTRTELTQTQSLDLQALKAEKSALLEKARQDRAGLENQRRETEAMLKQTEAARAEAEQSARQTEGLITQKRDEQTQAVKKWEALDAAAKEKQAQVVQAKARLEELITKSEQPAQAKAVEAARALEQAQEQQRLAETAVAQARKNKPTPPEPDLTDQEAQKAAGAKIEALNTMIQRIRTDRSAQEKQLLEINARVTQALAAYQTAEAQAQSAEQAAGEAESGPDKDKLETAARDKRKEARQAKAALDQLVTAEQQPARAALAQWSEVIASATEQKADEEKELTLIAAKRAVAEAAAAKAKAEQEREMAEAPVRQARQSLSTMEQAAQEAEVAARDANTAADQLAAAIQQLESQFAQIQAGLQQNQTTLDKLQAQRTALHESLANATQTVAKAEADYQGLETAQAEKMARLARQVDEQSTELNSLQSELDKLQPEVAEQQKRMETLKQSYQSLKASQQPAPAA